MPLSDEASATLTRRHQAALNKIVARSTPLIQSAWDHLDSYDEESVARLTSRTRSVAAAVKSASTSQAAGYYSLLTGVPSPGINVDDIAAEMAMREPFISTWQALSSGLPYDEAVETGRNRIEAVVSDAAISTARQTGDAFVKKAGLKVTGWKRHIHGGACGWCQEVAGGTYKSADSADFGHANCRCTVAPLDFVGRSVATPSDALPRDVELPPPTPIRRRVLTDAQYDQLSPKPFVFRETRGDTLGALRETSRGDDLAETLIGFQGGGSIPGLRSKIDRYLAGETLSAADLDTVENLLGALDHAPDWTPPKLFRGMKVEGTADDVLARYVPGSELDLNISSFTTDADHAAKFTHVPGTTVGKIAEGRSSVGVVIEVENTGGAMKSLPIQNIGSTVKFHGELEWIAGGRFEIASAAIDDAGNVVLHLRHVASLR